MGLLRLKIEDLNTRNLQTRAALNEDTVQDYADAMERGDRFPAVTVFTDGAEYYLADGFHRVEALRRIGKRAVVAELQEGDFKAALLYALKANSTHGLRRTNADKRHALEMAWNAREELFGGEPSNALLAEPCGVSYKTVQRFTGATGMDKVHTCEAPTRAEQGYSMNNPVPTRNANNAPIAQKTEVSAKTPERPETAPERPSRERGETPPAAPETPAPARRIGRDGKAYTVPTQAAPVRKPGPGGKVGHAPGVALDRFGVEIPMEIKGAFAYETTRDVIESHLRHAVNLLKNAMDEKDPSVAQFRQADLIDLQNTLRTARFTRPYCVCRICQGNGRGSCSACHETGFQTEEQYKRNPKEFLA